MGDTVKGRKDLSRLLPPILRHCFESRKEQTRDLIWAICWNKIVNRDERDRLLNTVEDGEYASVIDTIVDKILDNSEGISALQKVLEDSEIETEAKTLVAVVVKDPGPTENVILLIKLWQELVKNECETQKLIAEIWPDDAKTLGQSWPLHFIHFCTTETPVQDDVKKVVHHVSQLSQKPPSDKSHISRKQDDSQENEGSQTDAESENCTDAHGAEYNPKEEMPDAEDFSLISGEEAQEAKDADRGLQNKETKSSEEFEELDSVQGHQLGTEQSSIFPQAGEDDIHGTPYQSSSTSTESDRALSDETQMISGSELAGTSSIEDYQGHQPDTEPSSIPRPSNEDDVYGAPYQSSSSSTESGGALSDEMKKIPQSDLVRTSSVEDEQDELCIHEEEDNDSSNSESSNNASNQSDDLKDISTEDRVLDIQYGLSECRELILPIVEMSWPDNPELTDENNWPDPLIDFLLCEDGSVVDQFVEVCKIVFKNKEAKPDFKPRQIEDKNQQTRLLFHYIKQMRNSESTNAIAKNLAKLSWPGEKRFDEKWPDILTKICSKQPERKSKFVNAVKLVFDLVGTPSDEKRLEQSQMQPHPPVKTHRASGNTKSGLKSRKQDPVMQGKTIKSCEGRDSRIAANFSPDSELNEPVKGKTRQHRDSPAPATQREDRSPVSSPRKAFTKDHLPGLAGKSRSTTSASALASQTNQASNEPSHNRRQHSTTQTKRIQRTDASPLSPSKSPQAPNKHGANKATKSDSSRPERGKKKSKNSSEGYISSDAQGESRSRHEFPDGEGRELRQDAHQNLIPIDQVATDSPIKKDINPPDASPKLPKRKRGSSNRSSRKTVTGELALSGMVQISGSLFGPGSLREAQSDDDATAYRPPSCDLQTRPAATGESNPSFHATTDHSAQFDDDATAYFPQSGDLQTRPAATGESNPSFHSDSKSYIPGKYKSEIDFQSVASHHRPADDKVDNSEMYADAESVQLFGSTAGSKKLSQRHARRHVSSDTITSTKLDIDQAAKVGFEDEIKSPAEATIQYEDDSLGSFSRQKGIRKKSHAHFQITERKDGFDSDLGSGSHQMTTRQRSKGQINIMLQVAPEGLYRGEIMCYVEYGSNEPCMMEKISDLVYTASAQITGRVLQYKYLAYNEKNREYTYEYLPRDGYRFIQIEDSKEWKQYDASIFGKPEADSWEKICGKLMIQHLPDPNLEKVDETWPNTVGKWMNQMEIGWKTNAGQKFHYPPRDVLLKNLIEWIRTFNSLHEEASHRILCAMTLIPSLHKPNYSQDVKLYEPIFRNMDLSTLDIDQQKRLYNNIHDVLGLKSSSTEKICSKLRDMVSDHDDAIKYWMNVLPLIFLLEHAGNIVHQTDEMHGKLRGLLHPTLLLPFEGQSWKDKWSSARKKCSTSTFQLHLVDTAPIFHQLSRIHPWIVDCYQYLLDMESLLHIIYRRRDTPIAEHFNVTEVVGQLIHTNSQETFPLLKVEDYLTEFFEYGQQQKKAARELSDENINGSIESMKRLLVHLKVQVEKCIKLKATDVSGQILQQKVDAQIVMCMKMANHAAKWSNFLMQASPSQYTLDIVDEQLHAILAQAVKIIGDFTTIEMKELELCQPLLDMEWTGSFDTRYWAVQIQDAIKEKIAQLWPKDELKYLQYYTETVLPFPGTDRLMSCFNEKAFQCAASQLHGEVQMFLCGLFARQQKKPKVLKFLEDLFLQAFRKNMSLAAPSLEDEMQVLHFISEWPILRSFFDSFNNQDALKCFSSTTRSYMKRIIAVCGKFEDLLRSGKITANELKYIADNQQTVLGFFNSISHGSFGSNTDDLGEIIKKLTRRREKFFKEQENAETFFNLCESLSRTGINVAYGELHQLYVERHTAAKICGFFTSDDIRAHSESFCGLSERDLEDFNLMHILHESKIFHQFWEEITKDSIGQTSWGGDVVIQWKEVLQNIWTTVKQQLGQFVESLKNWTIKLDMIMKRFEFTIGEEEDILMELKKLYSFHSLIMTEAEIRHAGNKDAEQTAEQLMKVFNLKKSSNALKWVLDFKTKYDLQGNFSAVEDVKNMEENTSMALLDIGSSFLDQFPEELMYMKPTNLQILQDFTMQHDLISWLNSKMKDVNDVKTMCSLALNVAGESPIETDQVACLLSSSQGFAPLIFNLDNINGLQDLLERCKNVWENVEKDEKITKKWADSASKLAWFKTTESLYGSEEKQSLTYAENINQRGVYTIAKKSDGPPCLESSISLVVPPPSSPTGEANELPTHKEAPLSFDLAELQNLQSKLMLIAGEEEQGQQDIAQFVDVLTGVKTVAEAYVNLMSDGCMLFSDWSALITSGRFESTTDQMNELKLQVSIRFKENRPLGSPASLAMIKELAKTLREAHKNWKDYINTKRLEHYYLNEYSIQQMTYLCNELAKNNTAPLPDQVLALLSSDSTKLVSSVIQDALDKAIQIDDEDENTSHTDEIGKVKEDDLSELERKKRAIRTLVTRERLDEKLAKAAVQAEGYGDVEECLNWALLNQYDEKKVDEMCHAFETDIAYSHQTNESEEFTSILHNRTVKSLGKMIDEILNMVTESSNPVAAISTICRKYFEKTSVLTLQDYLSVEHLGKFLAILHENDRMRSHLQRDLKSPLKRGVPNLIMCTENDVIPQVLSFYMTNPEQPLPTFSEVLICSEETSADEVERFMRRAMCECDSIGDPLFCMAFTEKLKFKVSMAVENIFELLSHDQHVRNEYQLIIVSASKQDYLSGCFNKHQVIKWPEKINATEISTYLSHHLAREYSMFGDGIGEEEGTIVKVVASKRSGVGKSLHVGHLKHKLEPRWYIKAIDQIKYMREFLTQLHRNPGEGNESVTRTLLPPLSPGKLNVMLCSEEDILPTLLLLYMHNGNQSLPTSNEVHMCAKQTTIGKIDGFMRKAMCWNGNGKLIFALAFAEKLRKNVLEKIKAVYDDVRNSSHIRKDFQLVILTNEKESFKEYQMFYAGKELVDRVKENIPDLLAGKPSEEYKVDGDEKIAQLHPDATAWKSTEFGNFPTIENEIASTWHQTTIRLLEKEVDVNTVMKRLLEGKSIRINDSHFIHIDLTPAVEHGIEQFMFKLLVLGCIQDQSGKIWHRQRQHLYVIEMTESKLNKVQLTETSILNILPQTSCLSPHEALAKLGVIRSECLEVLKKYLMSENTDENRDLWMKFCQHLGGETIYNIHTYQGNELDHVEDNGSFEKILLLSGPPMSVFNQIRDILPEDVKQDLQNIEKNQTLKENILMDKEEFSLPLFQRPYQYLKHYEMDDVNLDDFQYRGPSGTPEDCIITLLRHCVMLNPSWGQLRHFCSFLNVQLQNCEESIFCLKVGRTGRDINTVSALEDTELKGLKKFAVGFMIWMSQDFATPSLDISDQSEKDVTEAENSPQVLDTHQIRRKWEEKSHPYIFFNEDRMSMSFINVNINRQGDLLDENKRVIKGQRGIASKQLVEGLKAQGIPIGENFDKLEKTEKLDVVRTIMGLPPSENDPDDTYELTTDNVLKMLAIHMRLRCGIPVIIMGETGCGKTRMVEYMSKLKAGKNVKARNMITLKIHGGITAADIYESVERAKQIAAQNSLDKLGTVLFYDEANTTTAIHAIKEVVCDSTIDGISFQDTNLRIVAACNPYKHLTKIAIEKLENSGVGYRVDASDTSERLGKIPMRRLVYKVVALPPSMQPFVWDFGQLNKDAEEKYIKQMTLRLQAQLKLSPEDRDLINYILTEVQCYMRKMEDECRYVSLRDVERCMKTFQWLHDHEDHLFTEIKDELSSRYEQMETKPPSIGPTVRKLLQTLNICYHASLEKRQEFREHISNRLSRRAIQLNEKDINEEFIACQNVFVRGAHIDSNIARNEALRENVFLITICADLCIPLFVIGKPGSSKSLAKTIVAANMEGKNSVSDVYREFKQVHMVPYQCSDLTDAAGIERVFDQCAKIQEKHKDNLNAFAAVVVLDEIGLAEDSPNMPLKILHPLLECGSTKSGTLTEFDPWQKVGFIGISNWALDPAKMNRGIFVTRSTPDEMDLFETAKEIFQKPHALMRQEENILRQLTKSYLEIYISQKSKEFFGLRDYYGLIKMINSRSKNSIIAFEDVAYAVERNFGGGDHPRLKEFIDPIKNLFRDEGVEPNSTIPVQDMIVDNLGETDTRFLLLLTNQFSSEALLQHIITNYHDRVQVIFGSSFPGDHNYTEICKNINRIKVCMEKGCTVVLLDMTEVHESLYDALNQHYSVYGGQRYVDIGLGGHRVGCRISKKFRLIVIEQKRTVYMQYPIPLINRLEKHHLVSESLLTPEKQVQAQKLKTWIGKFARVRGTQKSREQGFKETDAFIGYHDDTVSSVIVSVEGSIKEDEYKRILLQSATTDAVFRLPRSSLTGESEKLMDVYTKSQKHDNLQHLLSHTLNHSTDKLHVMEITSFSNILTENDRKAISEHLQLGKHSIMLLSLHQFDTQQEYVSMLDKFFNQCSEEHAPGKIHILLIQCPQAHKCGPLLACSKYSVMNMLKKVSKGDCTVIAAFLLSTQRRHGAEPKASHELLLQPTKDSKVIYVDDLRPPSAGNMVVSEFYDKGLKDILEIGKQEMEEQVHMRNHNQAQGRQLKINFMGLLNDSICQAMAMVKRHKNDTRDLKCMKILTNLLSIQTAVGSGFRSTLIGKMIDIYDEKDRDGDGSKVQWIIREALSPENLQEGGTFGKTLCLCLKRHLADLLAFIISSVDENNNLDLLCNQDEGKAWMIEMWLQYFRILDLRWTNMKTCRKEFNVHVANSLGGIYEGRLPFSFDMINKSKHQWDTLKDKGDQEKLFFQFFRKMPLVKVIQSIMQMEKETTILDAYAHDIIKSLFVYSGTTNVQHSLLSRVLFSVAMNMRQHLVLEKKYVAGDSIAIMFWCFQRYFKHFCMIFEIIQACPDLTSKADDWIKKQDDTQGQQNQVIIHVHALDAMLDWIGSEAYQMKDDRSCIEWMKISKECKRIYHEYIDLVLDEKQKQDLQKKWEPVSLLDLLLARILPSTGSDTVFTNYLKVIINHAKRLLKPLQRYGFREKHFLRIISNVLRKSYEDIAMKHLVSWQDTICKMCRQPIQNPVKLPSCGHFICLSCFDRIRASTEIRQQCPSCPKSIPADFHYTPAHHSENQERELEKFKSNCTSFFLEYLENFCFSDTDADMSEQAKLFLHEMVLEIPQNEGSRMEIETLAINMDIITKSNILQLLLKFDSPLIENTINSLLPTAGTEELAIVILNSFEQTLERNEDWSKTLDRCNEAFRRAWDNISNEEKAYDLQLLQHVADIRFSLEILVKSIQKNQGSPSTILDAYTLSAIEICSSDESEVLRNFVIKTGCQLFGRDWLEFVSSHHRFKQLIPEWINKAKKDESIDYWLILGDDYAGLRTQLHRMSLEEYRQHLPGWFQPEAPLKSHLAKILAVVDFSMTNNVGQLLRDLKHHFEISTLNDEIFHLIDMFYGKDIAGLSQQQSHVIWKLLILIGSIVLCQPYLMKEFADIASNPKTVMHSFWPAMPESLIFTFQYALREQSNLRTYLCPNGHPYLIGECGRPWTTSECIECGEVIGGFLHRAAEGNATANRTEAEEVGYQVDIDQTNKTDPSDRLSKQGVAVVRFILHSCMLIGLERDPDEIKRQLKCSLTNEDAAALLVHKLRGNISDMSETLGRNFDDAILTLFQCCSQIMKSDMQVTGQEPNLATMRNRASWESEFREVYLLPVFADLDNILKNAQEKCTPAENQENMLLFSITHEIRNYEDPEEITWQHPMLWKTIKRSNEAHLLQTIGDSSSTDRVLKIILQTPQLHLLQHMGTVLLLQKTLINKYQNQKDLNEVEAITFTKYMEDGEGYKHRRLIDDYIKLWNSIYGIFNKGQNKDMQQYLKPINDNTPVTIALPSTRGRGRCAKALSEHLIEIHNSFLEKCTKVIIDSTLLEVEVSQLSTSNFICIEKLSDLLPMINMHTTYTVTEDKHGRHHRITYNVDALEKQAREKYVMYKPRIMKRSLPCIKYPQDIGIGTDWGELKGNIEQQCLTNEITQELDDTVASQRVTPADVCEGVRTLTYAISFLAKIQADPSEPLHKYLEENLLLSQSRLTMIPKSALITHTLLLYQRLMWHKAVQFVEQGLDPYKEALYGVDQEDINDRDVLQQLQEAFSRMDMNNFQQHLNEILIQVPDFNPEWSLTESIFPYFEFIGNGTTDGWYEKIPKNIYFKNIAHLFQLAVKGTNIG